MPGLQYLVPALALAGGAFAACSTKGTMTITNSAQATELASCTSFTGSIEISSKAAGDITIDSLREINGDLIATNAKGLTSLSAPSLQSIKGELHLESLVTISTLSFSQLTEVDSLYLQNLGQSLTSPDFSGGISKIKKLFIDQCQFSSLDGLTPTEADSVMLTNNPFISNLMLPLTSVKGDVIVRGNVMQFSLKMPKLKKAGNIQLNNCDAISIPSLEEATDAISIVENTLRTFSLPKMKNAGSVTIDDNSSLRSLSVPVLSNVTGAFSVQNNTKLTGTLNFPKIDFIGGAPKIVGTFSGLNMPSLERVSGQMFIKSTKNIQSDCSHFMNLQGVSHVVCKSASANKPSSSGGNGGSGSGTGGESSGGSSGGSGGGNGAAGHHGASLGLLVSAFAGVTAFFAFAC